MMLNVCVKNTDDHLKNTGFVQSANPAKPGQLRLSPVFDVVTQAGEGLHYLHIGKSGRLGSVQNAMSESDRFGIKSAVAQKIADRVRDVVAERGHYYRLVGLDEKTLAQVSLSLEVHCPAKTTL